MRATEEIKAEIIKLEEELRKAELGPDPTFFEKHLADDAVLDGKQMKSKVVEAHRPGKGPKFDRVEMSEFAFQVHGDAVVVTCTGDYVGPQWSGQIKFMRVWLKRDGIWKIIAGSVWH